MNKIISSGLIITNKEVFLGCKVTGQGFYDIPKGKIDEGETPIEACIREVKEETDISILSNDLIDIGIYTYTPQKNLYLFLLFTNDLPSIDTLKCSSMFIHSKSGKSLPEINGYKYINWQEYDNFVCKSMNKVLKQIEENYIRAS